MKIVINSDFGGYGLSEAAIKRYAELIGLDITFDGGAWVYRDGNWFDAYSIPRNDPELVQAVEELGFDACDRFSLLKVVEIPDDVDWEIVDYDGMEHIAEVHRTWR
jgi:hypothetical protein